MKLSDSAIDAWLAIHDRWSRKGDQIECSFVFPTFAAGIAFVQRVAVLADEADHHPDIDIRYTRINIALSTHDAGGLTQRDTDLAEQIEATAG